MNKHLIWTEELERENYNSPKYISAYKKYQPAKGKNQSPTTLQITKAREDY